MSTPSAGDETGREVERLAALKSYEVLDTPSEEVFEELARLAALIVGAPTALVSFVDGKRQWFKARVGLEATETPRDVAFCAHAIGGTDVFIVPDAAEDERFVSNPLVSGDPGIRFYAGAPLITLEGHALGTLCVIDYVPREFTREQQEALRDLSQHVMAQLDLRRRLLQFVRDNPERQMTVAALRRALEEKQFLLHYQPIVDVGTGHITRLEALIRWRCPDRGLVAPTEFISVLEESGLIVEVGAWVLEQASSDYRGWLARGLTAPRIVVNVSPLQLQHPGFVAQLERTVSCDGKCRLPLDIEITGGVLENASEVIERAARVQRMGVQVALDDFGTGYSSLSDLAHRPIDALKIDGSLVAGMTRSPEGMALVSGIISLGHELHLQVVAEGVETAEQRKLLWLMRCQQMQGFLFAGPAPRDVTEQMLWRDQGRGVGEWRVVKEDVVGVDGGVGV